MADKKQWTTQSVGEALAVHVAGDQERDEKLRKVYEVLITGNGHEPLTQTVYRSQDWINAVKRFLWLLIGAVVAAIIAGAGATLTGLVSLGYLIIKIYPLLQNMQGTGITNIIAK